MTVGAGAELSVGGAVEGTTAACCCVSLTPLSYSVFSYYAAQLMTEAVGTVEPAVIACDAVNCQAMLDEFSLPLELTKPSWDQYLGLRSDFRRGMEDC